MSLEATNHLEKILSEYRSFDIGDTLTRGYEIWKKDIWSYMGFFILYMIIIMGLSMIPIAGQLATSILIGPALTLGAAIFAYRLYSKDNAEFSNFFDGFAHWQQIAILGIITSIISIILLSPIIFSLGWSIIADGGASLLTEGFDNLTFSTLSKVGIGISVLLLVYFSVCISFAVHFIGFFEVDAINAIKYSFKFVNRHWLWVFLYMIVAGIAACLGMILLLIGIIITAPLVYAFQFAAFDELTAVTEYFNKSDENDQVNIDEMFG